MLLDKYSGRMTYREMAYLILENFTEKQKDCYVTAADPLSSTDTLDCGDFGACVLDLVLPTPDECDGLGLNEDHPVFMALKRKIV